MKPVQELEISISKSLIKYFKIYDNQHATKEDIHNAMANAGVSLGHALGILISTLDAESAESALDSIKKYALEIRKDFNKGEKK